eukprot:1797278-Heterocapsa_arctica.AAC.1
MAASSLPRDLAVASWSGAVDMQLNWAIASSFVAVASSLVIASRSPVAVALPSFTDVLADASWSWTA